MPTPIGHGLAGLAVAWSAPSRGRSASRAAVWRFSLLCIALAAVPDMDLLFPRFHRTVSHSVTMTVFVTIVAIVVTRQVNVRSGDVRSANWRHALTTGLLCGAAWGSHLLLDWLGDDLSTPQGIQALWPFSDRWFISGLDLFPRVERRQPFSIRTITGNLVAVGWEIVVLGPVVAALWARRHKARPPALSRRHHASGGEDTDDTSDRR
jgi:membrane-bound metal-dependent hydrolase YbcI (DUF457 family)